MVTHTLRLVRILWTAVGSVDEALRLVDRDSDVGLYQVYGDHVVFGAHSLLYIGSAVDQTVGKRLSQHDERWMRGHGGISIHVGRVRRSDYKHEPPHWKDWAQAVHDAESLLIYTHSPPYNSRGIQTCLVRDLHVQNWNERGRLVPECTSSWMPERPQDDVGEAG